MWRAIAVVVILAAAGSEARAQWYSGVGPGGAGFPMAGQTGFGGPYQTGFPINPYANRTSPLSPYLNLALGRSPAVNYFSGVRPMTQSMPTGNFGGMGAGQMRPQTFFPQLDTSDLATDEVQSAPVPPTGHPAGFGNTLGYFSPQGGMMPQRGAQGMPARRPGLTGQK